VFEQVLPEEFAGKLRALKPDRRINPAICATVAEAKRRGWTFVAIGNAFGVDAVLDYVCPVPLFASLARAAEEGATGADGSRGQRTSRVE
jgi:hypothetical protein